MGKKETTSASTPAHVGTEESLSEKSTPLKGKLQSTFSGNTSAKGKGRGNFKNELNLATNATQKMKCRSTNKQQITDAESSAFKDENKSKESKHNAKIKPGGEEREKVGDAKNNTRSKQAKASSLTVSHQSTLVKVVCKPISSQSPEGAKVVSINTKLVDWYLQEDAQDLIEQNPRWQEILSTGATLLPAAGIAGAAMEVLSVAVTSLGRFQSSSDTVTSTPTTQTSRQVKQFTKQSAVMQASFSSTLSH